MIAMGKSTERVGTVRVCITFDSFTSPHGWEVARASVTDVRHGVPVRGDCREPSATGQSKSASTRTASVRRGLGSRLTPVACCPLASLDSHPRETRPAHGPARAEHPRDSCARILCSLLCLIVTMAMKSCLISLDVLQQTINTKSNSVHDDDDDHVTHTYFKTYKLQPYYLFIIIK